MRTLSYLDPAPVSSRYHLKSTCSNRNIKTSILPLITKGEGKSVSRSNTIHHILCVGSSLLTEYLDKNILHTLPLSGNNYIYIDIYQKTKDRDFDKKKHRKTDVYIYIYIYIYIQTDKE